MLPFTPKVEVKAKDNGVEWHAFANDLMGPGDECSVAMFYDGVEPGTAEGNARLFMAAPALLERVEMESSTVEQLREWARLLRVGRRTPLESIISGMEEVANDLEDRQKKALAQLRPPAKSKRKRKEF